MPKIILHQFSPMAGVDSGSPFCTKVHRALSFKGLDYTPRDVKGPGELKRLNPARLKVPVLEYDGEVILDSSAILAFLEQRHPTPPLLSDDALTLAHIRLVEDWADESLYWFAVYHRWAIEANFKNLANLIFDALPPLVRWFVPGVVHRSVLRQLHGQGLGRLEVARVNEQLDAHLTMLDAFLAAHPFAAGDTLTAADLAVFGPLQAMRSPITPEAQEVVNGHPPVVDWLRRVDDATRGPHTAAVV